MGMQKPQEQIPGMPPPSSMTLANMEIIERLEKRVGDLDKRMERKLDKILEDMTAHIGSSNEVHIRLAVVETKLATVTKIMWGLGSGLVALGAAVAVKVLEII